MPWKATAGVRLRVSSEFPIFSFIVYVLFVLLVCGCVDRRFMSRRDANGPHSAGEIAGLEAVLHQDARREIGAAAGAADRGLPCRAGVRAETRAQLRERDVDHARDSLDGEFRRMRTSRRKSRMGHVQCATGMSRALAATIREIDGDPGAAEGQHVRRGSNCSRS